MSPLLVLPYYIYWHYHQGFILGFEVIKNFAWFFWHFFSIPELLRTLFQPWQRLHEDRVRGGGMENILTVWLINVLMIMAGALIRLTFVSFGLVFIAITWILGAAAMVLWLALPLCALVFMFIGFILLFKPL